MNRLIIVKGGGDLATGIAHRLFRSGFDVLITEIAQPTVIRRTVAFASAVFEGRMTVEAVTAVRATPAEVAGCLRERLIPVLIDPTCQIREQAKPWGLVDAILAKKNTGTTINDAPVVIGVGPGFTAGVAVHRVVETMRGHDLGRVIETGAAEPNTGIPGDIGGYTLERLVTAPADGIFWPQKQIGDVVAAGDILGTVSATPVVASISSASPSLILSTSSPRTSRSSVSTESSITEGERTASASLGSGLSGTRIWVPFQRLTHCSSSCRLTGLAR